ncbi:MAG: type II secretion system protein GspG [Patescibacteria group bacterium]
MPEQDLNNNNQIPSGNLDSTQVSGTAPIVQNDELIRRSAVQDMGASVNINQAASAAPAVPEQAMNIQMPPEQTSNLSVQMGNSNISPTEISGQQPVGAAEVPKQTGSIKKGLIITIIAFFIVILGMAGLVFATEEGYLNTGIDKYYSKIGLYNLWGGLPYDSKPAMAISALAMSDQKKMQIDGTTTITLSYTESSNIPYLTNFLNNNSSSQIAMADTGKVLGESIALGNINDNTNSSINLNGNLNSNSGVDSELLNENINSSIPESPSSGNQKYSVSMNYKVGLDNNNADASLNFDLTSLSSNLDTLGLSSIATNAVRLDLKVVDDKLYFRIPALSLLIGSDNNKWYEFDLKDLTATTDYRGKVVTKISQAGDVINSGEKTGSETIDGVKVNNYKLNINALKLAQLLTDSKNVDTTGLETLNKVTVTADVSIAKKDHLIRKINIVTNYSDQGVTVETKNELLFSQYGAVTAITAPADDEIDSTGITGLMSQIEAIFTDGTSITGSRERARDAVRKSDLRSLQAALEIYYEDNNAYPLSKSVVKTSDENNILTVLVSSNYLKTLPIDPVPDKYYYGYKSVDGKSFELTAILEDITDTSGAMSGNFNIYKLTNDIVE